MSNFLDRQVVEVLRSSFETGASLRSAAAQAHCSENTVRRYYINWRTEATHRRCSTTKPGLVDDFLALKASDIMRMPARYMGGFLWDRGRNWSAEDLIALITLCAAAADPDKISPILAREPNAIVWRASDMGLLLAPNWRSFIYVRRQSKPREVRQVLQYPYVMGKAKNDHAFLLAVNAVVPQGLPGDLRNDVCQDMLLAIIEGDLSMDDVKTEMGAYLKAARKRYSMPWGTVNIDAPLWDDGRSLSEVISENTLYQ